MDIADCRRVPPLTGLPSNLGHAQWPQTSNAPEMHCQSSRYAARQPFSPAPHRTQVCRAGGSLDFWSSSMALAGFYPNKENGAAQQWTGDRYSNSGAHGSGGDELITS